MGTKRENDWLILAKHEQWIVEYRPESRIVRVHLDGTIIYLERESFQLFWGVITEGLDEMERVEDYSTRITELNAVEPKVSYSQTRH